MTSKSESARHQEGVLRVFQSRDETRAYYDKISRVYDFLAERSEEPMRQEGLAMLGAQPGEGVLEIGPGTGHSLTALAAAANPGGSVYGIDLSEGMLRVARGNLEKAGAVARVRLLCADAASLPFPSSVLDAIFMSFTLELFDTPDIPRVLGECRRVLRPGGRIVVVSLSKEGPASALVNAYEWTHRHFPNFLDCRPIFVQRAISDAGFRIVGAEIRKMWLPVEIVLASAS